MTLGNTRKNGVRHLIGFCHNDACRDSYQAGGRAMTLGEMRTHPARR
jgi:hypothetical protein